MQQVKNVRDRLNSQAQWIQLGLLSASILAPLVKRWNELRAMERTRALREDMEERLQMIRGSSPWSRHTTAKEVEEVINDTLPPHHQAPRSSTILWVVGVGVGVMAAGIGTYVLVKQRMAAYREEPLVPLPFRRPSGTTSSAPAAPLDEPLGSMTLSTRTVDTDNAKIEQSGSSSVPDAEAAAIVGNIRTMVYHLTNDGNLPDEDNRVYFSSEDEARLAGFHCTHDEVTVSENRTAD